MKIKDFEKAKQWSGDMVERELPTKFGLDPYSGFQETRVYGQQTVESGRWMLRHDSSSADKDKQS